MSFGPSSVKLHDFSKIRRPLYFLIFVFVNLFFVFCRFSFVSRAIYRPSSPTTNFLSLSGIRVRGFRLAVQIKPKAQCIFVVGLFER